jgi:hypothetical protein
MEEKDLHLFKNNFALGNRNPAQHCHECTELFLNKYFVGRQTGNDRQPALCSRVLGLAEIAIALHSFPYENYIKHSVRRQWYLFLWGPPKFQAGQVQRTVAPKNLDRPSFAGGVVTAPN